ncbi:hypothetical protein [uncultured Desulfobacter sp.]|uniref:hypothetical protein n=1 Tax=uncultured Desulfobacter sp. TaxID=240139 RepID=UPI002AA89F26|nr:hypothetical protein [uncultured Desulfobacter sp.]
MDKVIFGDNQFFGVNHLSEEKARAQALKFKDNASIIKVLDYVYDIGVRTFMCTTHDRIEGICEHIIANESRYQGFKIYPCMPYAHKYNNAVTELGPLGAMKRFMPGNVIGTMAKGGMALARKDYISMMKLLIDFEMRMFEGINTPVVFLQNVVTDLILGLGMNDFLGAFYEYIQSRYNAEAGFITMNMPKLLGVLEGLGIKDPIICSSINKIGFRMSGGKDGYEKVLKEKRCRAMAMQVLAAGALLPKEAIQYVSELEGVDSILFGASTSAHIKQTKDLIDQLL